MKTIARTIHVHLPSLQHGSCWDPCAAAATYTGHAGLNWSYKTEAHVGINCCKSDAEKISISFWLPRFSGIDDPVLASTKWIYSPSCQREERLSLMVCLQPASPVRFSFLFLDVPLNACGGQRGVTGCDTPCACQKGSFFPCKLHHGLLCTARPLEVPRAAWSVQLGDARESPRGCRFSRQGEGSSSWNRNNSHS